MEFLGFNHLRGAAYKIDMSAPECSPGQMPFLDSKDEELHWPEANPGAMCHVPAIPETIRWLFSRYSSKVRLFRPCKHYSQHAIRLIPSKLLLDEHSRLCLNREADQTQHQEKRSNDIFSASRTLRIVVRSLTSERRSPTRTRNSSACRWPGECFACLSPTTLVLQQWHVAPTLCRTAHRRASHSHFVISCFVVRVPLKIYVTWCADSGGAAGCRTAVEFHVFLRCNRCPRQEFLVRSTPSV